MDNKRKIPDLQHGSLKKQPFTVPEGYFESFSDRLQARIREEKNAPAHVRRIGSFTRFRVAMAAAIIGVALISYSVLRFAVFNNGPSDQNDMALAEEYYLTEDDYSLMKYLESGGQEMDDNEAFANQAIDYLASNNVDMILLLE
jgi:hypothetical protein